MNKFNYLQPKTLYEASAVLNKENGSSIPFAGGTDILGLIKQDIISPQEVVNIKNIPGIDLISYSSGKGLRIGALVKIDELIHYPAINEKYSIISDAAKEIASPQIRNIGTIGGNICQRPRCWYYREDFDCIRKGGGDCYAYEGENKYHCVIGGGPCYIVHPSDMAVALLALDAKVTIFSGKESRTIDLKDFFILPEIDSENENILKPGEIVTEFIIPEIKPNTKSGYIKFKEREVWDFSVVSVGAVVQVNGKNIRSGRITFGGVAPIPWMEESTNKMLKGLEINDESLKKLTEEILRTAKPLSMNTYKLRLVRNLAKRLILALTS